jgi:periplasmic divalent cation tolerance protein
MQPEHVVVLTTLPSGHDARAFAASLVEARLAACVNVLAEMESVYRWNDRIEHDRERQVVIKTTAARLAALTERIGQVHPYDVPEIVVIPIVDGSHAYLRWVSEVTI